MRKCLPALAGLLWLSAAAWAEAPPPAPAHYFNDDAGLVSPADAQRLDAKLERFDKETSNQVLVVIYPELPSPSLEDFTVKAAQAWRVGRKKLDNGVVLFVFVKDRRARLEVGYGLEGALPDALASRILDEKLRPAFAAGHHAEGLDATIEAIFAATRGEYRAQDQAPAAPAGHTGGGSILLVLVFFILPIFLLSRRLRHFPAATYDGTGYDASPWTWGSPYGRRRRRDRDDYWGGGGGSWGGGGGGGGGFSGGGGSFGGGGATGSW